MSRYSPEDRERILAAGRQAISDAETVLNTPRPAAADWPPVEDRVARFRREAREQAEAFAQERRSTTLAETEAARLEHRLAGLVEQEKRLVLDVIAHALAAVRDEVVEHLEQKVAELSGEVGLLRADLAVTKAINNNSGGEIIDLPALPLRRRAMNQRDRMKVEILISARIAALRKLAEKTARDYEADQFADSDLPPEHRRLRRMLLGRLLPPPRRSDV